LNSFRAICENSYGESPKQSQKREKLQKKIKIFHLRKITKDQKIAQVLTLRYQIAKHNP